MSKSSTNISHRPHGHKNYWKPLIVAAACVAVLLFVLANSTINHHESRSHDQEDSSERFAILAASRRQQKALPVIKVKHMESTVSMLPFTELPGFAIGNREYVFTSLIERSMANILDFHVTTFLLGHTFIQAPELPSRNVRKHRQGDWSRAAQHASKTEYYPSGRRKYVPKDRFTCRIRHSSKSQPYIVAGDFVPNRATSTVSSNRRIDILRCPFVLHDIVELQRLLMDDDSMQVEIYQGSVALIAFEIPWRRRVVGYLSNSPREAFSLDLWDGVVCSDPSCHVATMNNASFLPLSTNGVLDGKPKPLTVHLCAPCMKKAISRDNLPMVLEYIAHHLNIGFEHITIASVWHPASVHFQRLVNLLAPFIRDRQLSILSLADPRDETSPLFEIEGMAFFRYVMATIQANLCLYLSKGVADYLLVQDLDELLVPKSIDVDRDTIGHLIASNIADNLVANADSTVGWIGGPGWADGHRHPLCYLAIQSELILRSASAVISATTLHRPRPWLGEEFGHGAEINSTRPYVASRQTIQNSIVPVQDIFYVGTRSPGACALPWQWNGCNNADVEICLDPFGDVEPAGIEPETIARQRIHTFDERVLQRDARLIPKSDAVVYHFRFYDSVIVASESTMNSTNAYSSHWFPRARKLLESKGFGFFFDLPVGVSSGVMPGKSADLMPLLSASNSDVNSLTSGNDVPMVSEGVEVASVEDGALLNDPFAEVLAPLQPFPPFALTTLPHFSNDLSELALTSMIERTASSYHLFATTFFLCHYTARNQANINQQVFLRVHPKAQEKWSYIQSLYSRTRFTLPGKRAKVDEFTCRLRTVERIDGSRGGDTSSVNSTVYQPVEDYVMVRGVFVPSATTIDFNANYRVETLRCSLGAERSRKAYHDYAGKSQYLLEVEIYKNSARLMGFVVPWEARVTGYMSFSPRPIAEWQEGLMDAVGASGDVKDWLEADDAATSGGSQSETETVVSDAVAGGEGEAEEVDWAVSSSSNTGLANIPGASPPSATVPTSDASSSLKTSTLTAEGSLVGRIRARALYALPSTSLSPWDGVDLAMPPQQWSMQRLFLCVPGVRTAPSRHFLPHLLEFLEHHYRMGVSHILLAVCFSWRSIHMRRLLRAVRPYIEEKKLSIQTHTVHPLDFRFVVGGAVARNTPIKVFATHLCLYYAKGLADYLAVWDVDEFFVPHGSNQNLIDLLDHADNISTIHDPLSIPPATAVIPPSQSFISQPAAINWTVWNDEYRNHPHPHGWADGHAHPLCYLQLYSTALYQVPGRTAESSSEYIWFADNFQPRAKAIDHLAHKKAIHPTRRSFSLNLHTGGACALPQQWTDCAVSTSSPANLMVDLTRNASLSMTLSAAGVLDPLLAAESSGDDQAVHCLASRKSIRTEFAARHNFDEPPHLGDAHNFDRDTEGELYHVQFFRRKHLATNKSAPDEVSDNNLYAKHFGAGVRHALDMRGLFWPLHLLNDPGFRGPSSLLSTPRDAHAPSTHSATVDGMVVLSAFLDGLATTQGAELRVLLALDPDQAGLSAPKRVRQLGTTGQVATTLPAGWMLSSTGNASHAAELKWKTPCPRAVRAVTCTVLIGSSSSSLPVEIPAKVETIMAGVISIQCPISQDLSEKLCLDGGQSMLTSLLISYSNLCENDRQPEQSYRVAFDLNNAVRGVGLFFPPSSSRGNITDWPVPGRVSLNTQANALRCPSIAQSPAVAEADEVVHLCASRVVRAPMWRGALASVLEFVTHHLLLGVQRIYLPVAADVAVPVSLALESYVKAGKVWLFIVDDKVTGWRLKDTSLNQLVEWFCLREANNSNAAYLALWTPSHFFIPSDAPLNAAPPLVGSEVSKLLGPQSSISLEAKALDIKEFLDNFDTTTGIPSPRHLWLGEIYRSAPSDSTSSNDAGCRIQRIASSEGGRDEEQSPRSGARSVLYEVLDVDLLALPCRHKLLPSPLSTLVNTSAIHVDDLRDDPWRLAQQKRLCDHLLANSSSTPPAHSSIRRNIYRERYFPAVFATLLDMGADLFVDAVPLENDEVDSNYRAGDESWPDYSALYVVNPLHAQANLPSLQASLAFLAGVTRARANNPSALRGTRVRFLPF